MKLVIISGPSASGKTTIGKRIADELDYSFYSKDQIKEELFDSGSRSTYSFAWYEKQATNKFYALLEQAVKEGKSLVIESDFHKSAEKPIRLCINKNVQIVEVYCFAKGLVRFKRYIKRNESQSRHHGHHDRRWYPVMLFMCLSNYLNIYWPNLPLKLSHEVLMIDSSDFSKIDYPSILDRIK
jgi:predicted kinase